MLPEPLFFSGGRIPYDRSLSDAPDANGRKGGYSRAPVDDWRKPSNNDDNEDGGGWRREERRGGGHGGGSGRGGYNDGSGPGGPQSGGRWQRGEDDRYRRGDYVNGGSQGPTNPRWQEPPSSRSGRGGRGGYQGYGGQG